MFNLNVDYYFIFLELFIELIFLNFLCLFMYSIVLDQTKQSQTISVLNVDS